MKIRIQTKNKANGFYEAVGISEKRAKEILALVKECEKKNDTKSGTLQLIADQVKDAKELSIASFWFGQDNEKMNKMHEVAEHVAQGIFGGATPNQVFSAVLDAFVFFFALLATMVAIVSFQKMWYFLPLNLLIIGLIMWQRKPWRR